MKRQMFVPALSLAALVLSAPVQAQTGGWLDRYRPSYADERQSYYDARRTAYDNGYREGLKEGEKDAKKHEPYRYQDEKSWQHADKGYRREYGDIGRYQQAFRSGYAEGYTQMYQQYSPYSGNARYGNNPRNGRYGDGDADDYGRYGDGRAVPRPDANYPVYPNQRQYPQSYPNQYPGQYGQYGGYNNGPAFDNGSRDGFEKGQEDARKGRSYDPLRHDWYRDASRNYDSRYGTRDAYKDVYRDGFRAGYDRGYRGGYSR
jgi:hypothetical protein